MATHLSHKRLSPAQKITYWLELNENLIHDNAGDEGQGKALSSSYTYHDVCRIDQGWFN